MLQTIRIPRGAPCGPEGRPIYGFAEVKAICEGGLAVHKATDDGPGRWRVTHVASGLCIGPLNARTRARALTNMRAALALPFDWALDESAVLPALRASRGIVDACRKIGAE